LNNTDVLILIALILVAWVLTMVGLVWLILGIAKLALKRARAQDVPEVLGALTKMVAAMPWLGHLSHLVRTVVDTTRTAPPTSEPPVIEGTTSDQTAISGPSIGGTQ